MKCFIRNVFLFTLLPRFMVSPYQTGFCVLDDEVHQFFRGMLSGSAAIQVSPISMLQ